MSELPIPLGVLADLRGVNAWTAPRARAAVAPIVAAELRRMAARMCTNDAQELERRAFELDGGAS